MSSSAPKKTRRFRFSLGYLIVFTAIVAIWASAFLARQKLPALQSHRDIWKDVATHGDSTNVVVEHADFFDRFSPDFQPYEVYIPKGKPRELRFFCGDVSEKGLPPELIELAKRRTAEIATAYDRIRKKKGFS